MQRTPALTLLASAIAVLLAACTTSTPAPVVDRTARPVASAPTPPRPAPVSAPAPVQPGMTVGSQFYVVQKGDTLYGVARANNLDPNTLATWNSLPPGSGLRDGQVLRLTPPLGSAPAVTAPGTTVTAAPTAGRRAKRTAAHRPRRRTAARRPCRYSWDTGRSSVSRSASVSETTCSLLLPGAARAMRGRVSRASRAISETTSARSARRAHGR